MSTKYVFTSFQRFYQNDDKLEHEYEEEAVYNEEL